VAPPPLRTALVSMCIVLSHCTVVCCVLQYRRRAVFKMATRMRGTVFLSLVLVLASPTRPSSSSALFPFPVSCLERCADANAACVDACRRETEIETGEFPAAEKRASAFVRIGRPSALDRRASSSFIRIGKI